LASMENVADISDPQIQPNEPKIHQFNLPSVYLVSMGEIETWLINKQMEN